MLTKGAIGNLVNRYRAVLKKCNLINTFGSLAVASMLVLGGAGVAEAETYENITNTTSETISSSILTVTDNLTITNSTFSNKTTSENPKGLIFNSTNKKINVTIDKSHFTDNGTLAGKIYAPAFYYTDSTFNSNSITVKNSTFNDNKCSWMAGAIYIGSTTATFYNNTFDGNEALAAGGVFYINGSDISFSGDTFSNNTGDHGGGIAIDGYQTRTCDLNFTNVTFDTNTATGTKGGGALNVQLTNGNIDVTVASSTFTGNEAEAGSGGAITFGKEYTGDGTEYSGTMTITDSTFTGNIAKNDGGAIYNGKKSTLIISNSTFSNNTVTNDKMYGGAIFSKGILTIENSEFSGNKATGTSSFGGAIYVNENSTGSITDTDFIGNSAMNGGALASGVNTSNLTIKGGTFSENSAQSSGGALGIFGTASVEGSAKIEGVTFNKNTAGLGGAAILGAESFTSFTDAVFNGNEAEEEGGAIATRAAMANGSATDLTDAGLTLTGGSFDGNIAGTMGGAIYNSFFKDTEGKEAVKVNNVTFSNNSAKDGGAIYNDGTKAGKNIGGVMTITDSNFTGNKAEGLGGAIYNSGILTLNGTNVFSGNTDSTGANDIHNLGTLTINGEAIFNGGISGTGTVNGSGTIVVNSADATFSGKADTADGLTAKGSADLNDQTGGDIDALNKQLAGLGIKASGMDEGLVAGEVAADGTKKVNTILADTLEQATAAPLAVNRILMNDVRKRMGDLRADKNESGVWMRWDGGKLQGDGLTNNFNTIQIGGDTKVAKNCRFGVAGSFTHGDIDQSNGGGEMEAFTFAAYGTWMAENGMFADVIARVGFTNSELQVKGSTADLDNEALSFSAEYGWRLPVCDQFFLEPQVELTYTHVTGADFSIKSAKYDIDSVDSVIGRAGLVAGWNLPNDMGNVYARASVVHEFLGDSKISATNNGGFAAHELDGNDTWVEYGIGANVKLTDKTYIWADVERTEGAELDEEWRGTVGIRYSF